MAKGAHFRWQAVVLIGAVLFVGMQFVRPALTNPPVTAELQVPPEVKQILKTSCYNCHSNETTLSWFDKPAPAYWIVARDVKEARKHLNFSEIGKLPAAQQRAMLFEAVSQIELGAMPLPAYRRLHPGAAVTPEQLAVLKKYLTPVAPPKMTAMASDLDAAAAAFADAQYSKWIQSGSATPSVAPAPNGIAFLPDYKNWRAVSSTERSDNHTLRVILGNDVAINAIAENHINPWPDGTIFAKVAWVEQPNYEGMIQTGAFFQVEFMIRDSKKYEQTKGWGWARWRGAELKPYGQDATFTNECVGCHNPLTNTNYVFTAPIRGQQ